MKVDNSITWKKFYEEELLKKDSRWIIEFEQFYLKNKHPELWQSGVDKWDLKQYNYLDLWGYVKVFAETKEHYFDIDSDPIIIYHEDDIVSSVSVGNIQTAIEMAIKLFFKNEKL